AGRTWTPIDLCLCWPERLWLAQPVIPQRDPARSLIEAGLPGLFEGWTGSADRGVWNNPRTLANAVKMGGGKARQGAPISGTSGPCPRTVVPILRGDTWHQSAHSRM